MNHGNMVDLDYYHITNKSDNFLYLRIMQYALL